MYRIILCLLAVATLLSSCAKEDKSRVIRLGTLQTWDCLPLHVAQREGLFEQQGIRVELVPFQSAMERDSAFQAKQLDGMASDLVSAVLLNAKGQDVRVVLLTVGAQTGVGRVAILTAPGSPIQNVEELKGAKIALSLNTVLEYIHDELLVLAGIDPNEVVKTPVPKIPVRMAMLVEGQVDAAVLPDPLAAYAELKGARALIDDTLCNLGQATLTFHQRVLKEREGEMEKLMRAYEQAVAHINAQPDRYQSLASEIGRLPPELEGRFQIIQFPNRTLPSTQHLASVQNWLIKKGLLKEPLPYDRCVDDQFARG